MCTRCGHFPIHTGTLCLGCHQKSEVDTILKKRKSKLDDYDETFFSSSDDDDAVTLTSAQKLEILAKKGKVAKAKYENKKLVMAGKALDAHGQLRRKAIAVRRAGTETPDTDLILVGSQLMRVENAKGHYIQPGGNQAKRPKGVKEPPSTYQDIFEQMADMGTDKNAAPLLKDLGQPAPGARLSDPEIARMSLHYMQSTATDLEAKLKGRTQLTEHLSKLTAVLGVAELSRSMEAEEPYDATLLGMASLNSVAQGQRTLKEAFFSGPKSVFLGAPPQGGADDLRKPIASGRLDRQMAILPSKKREFKKALNAFRANAPLKFTKLTKAELKALKKVKDAETLAEANQVLRQIENECLSGIDFLEGKGFGTYRGFSIRLAKIGKKADGNEDVLGVLAKCKSALEKKRKNPL
jgi:hypothetical protein